MKACAAAGISTFELYTFRHTCLTRWAASGIDPWTLAYLAGHRDMSITRRYVHPQEHTVREAMGRARVAAEKLDKPFDLPNTQYHGQKAKKRLPIDALGAAVFRDSFGDPVENDLGWEIRKVCEFVRAFEGGKNVNPAEDESPSHRHA